jgi:hypothetical protein
MICIKPRSFQKVLYEKDKPSPLHDDRLPAVLRGDHCDGRLFWISFYEAIHSAYR